MPRGDKKKYTSKQKRQAEHIEESYEKRGAGKKTAAARAWRTVNKTSGGGKKSGSGAKKSSGAKKKSAAKKSTRSGAKKKSSRK
jgi:plasmid stabilization system protein ParE